MKCPTCGKPTEWNDNPARPFCSERCKLIDFGRWANEEFRVPGPASEEHLDNDSASKPSVSDDESASE